jgi:four helix bundle protein
MGESARKGDDIAERLLGIAAQAVKVAGALPRNVAGRHVGTQLIRCGTSGGANYEEARAAESRADFIHKIGVATKEVRETSFWFRLIAKTSMYAGPLDGTLKEADELVAILVASIRTARAKTSA